MTDRLLEIQHLSSAAALLSWDQETYMPRGGGAARADLLATVYGLAHDRFVSAEIEDLLARWIDPATGQVRDDNESWNEQARALLREVWRDFSRAKKLPVEFVKRHGRTTSLAQQVWAEAKEKNDYPTFLPHLRTIIALKQEEAQYLGFTGSPYDALLDTYEPGTSVAGIRPLFEALRSRLVPLLHRVMASPVKIDDSLLARRYDPGKQMDLARLVLTAMGYDFDKGRLDVSAHPFTTSFHPTDVRVTTRIHERELLVCLYSCIHEGGHALYDQGLDPTLWGTPLGEPLSVGIHESQSRLWENCVGRSRTFVRWLLPALQQIFPEQLLGVGHDDVYAAMNKVMPSLIRIEADELTYNLHIMLRFEIEVDLIEGRVGVEDVPSLWHHKMNAYLGLAPERDAEGVLQDVHWSSGAFGYFPTYTLGNLYAARLYEHAHREMPDLDAQIEAGRLVMLTRWLNQTIHRWGRTYTADHLIQRVTGRPLTPDSFLTYLETKYGELYQL